MRCGASTTCCGSRAVFPSIRARLTVWLALLVTLCLAAFAVYLYVAVGQIVTANLDQTLRVQAQQIAAIYDFDVLDDIAQDREKDQRRVDIIVGGRSAASRVWAEVLDTQGHILTRSSNLGPRHVPLPAPARALVHTAPHLATLPAPMARLVDAPPHLSTQAVPGGALHVYSLPARQKGHIVGVVVVAAWWNKAATTTPAAVGRILTADLDQALRVQAHQIAAIYDFDVLQLDQEQVENQQRVDTSVGGQSAASRVWAEVFDTRGHILTRSSNLGPQHVPLPAPVATLVHAPPHLSTQAAPGGALHVYSWPALDDDGKIGGLVVVAAPLDKVQATMRLLQGL